MALTPQNDAAFIREVDEELRREQVTKLAIRHARNAGIAILVLLVVFAGYLWWQHHREEQAGVEGERLTQALADLGDGKEKQATGALSALAGSSSNGYSAAAKLTLAALKQQKGDAKGAAAGFQAVADDSSVPQPMRDLATVRAIAAVSDTMPPAELIAKLKPFAVAGNAWFGTAGELSAIALLRMNRTKEAAALFAAIARDRKVPQTIRLRASKMASGYGADAFDPQLAAPAAASQPSPTE